MTIPTIIASNNLWMEGEAIKQLEQTAKLPFVTNAVGLPDLHPGQGYPVGATIVTKDWIYPTLIGNDIGCGMSLFETDVMHHQFKTDKAIKKLDLEGEYSDDYEGKSLITSHQQSIGTIGGGNHFMEIQKVDSIIDETLWGKFGANHKNIFLLVHTGSRGLGTEVLREHVDLFKHIGVDSKSEEALRYIKRHNEALNYAKINREVIAQRVEEQLKMELTHKIGLYHNFLESKTIEGEEYWIHRKGAAKLEEGFAVIPGSRGDYSYIVYGNSEELHKSWYSIAHGAGRKWQRSECCARISKQYKATELTKTALGSHVICENKTLLFEEAPEAYKPIKQIIESLVEHNLVTVVAKLKPIISYKTKNS